MSLLEHAACKGLNPELFENPELAEQGLAVCANCIAKAPCADLRRRDAEGIYGGKAFYARKPTDCPVCRRRTTRAGTGLVVRHRDNLGRLCPMSGQPMTEVEW